MLQLRQALHRTGVVVVRPPLDSGIPAVELQGTWGPLDPTPPCQWHGVLCNAYGRITRV